MCRFTLNLDAKYNTGDTLSVNHKARWRSLTTGVSLNVFPVNNKTDAIVEILLPKGGVVQKALIAVEHDGFQQEFQLINVADAN